jgi:CHAT domain-containing protein/Tfp pilus assembly protein PilF
MPESKNRLFHQPLGSLLVATCLIVLFQATAASASLQEADAPPTPLTPGQMIERPLKGGETHSFQVSLAAGQYLCVEVEQRGIDIELRIAGPTKQMLVATDALNSSQGPEIAAIETTETGLHRIDIVSPGTATSAGTYQVKILALRPTTEADRVWLTAQRFYLEGKQLSEQSTATALEQAVGRLSDALRIWQVQEDRLMVAHTLYYLVAVYRDLGQTQHALVYCGYALELLRALNQPREEAAALTTLANVFSELGELPKARDCYRESLVLWRNFRDTNGEARALLNLGLVNTQLGELRLALENYNQALGVWRTLGNRFQEAETLARMGLAFDHLGEWQKALENGRQALTLYRGLSNKRGEAMALNNLGLVYVKLGEADTALDYYQPSLALWRTLGNRREEANTLSNIGAAEAQQNLSTKALSTYQQSLPLWQQAGDRRGEARALQRLGELYSQLGDSNKALAYFEQSLILLRTAGDRLREAEVLTSYGNVMLSQGDTVKAKASFTEATAILKDFGNRAIEAQALFGLARVECTLGHLPQSRRFIEEALAKVETIRASVDSQQSRTSYRATAQPLYEFHLDLLMRMHDAQPSAGFAILALQASERARARILLEQLAEARADIRQGIDATLLARERGLAELLNAKAERRLQWLPGASDPQWRNLQQEIRQIEDEQQQVQARIRQVSPHYAALTLPQPLGLREIQALLDTNTLLLEYALGDERSFLWVVSADGVASYQLPKRSQIEDTVRHLGKSLNVRAGKLQGETAALRAERIADADALVLQAARKLSEWLLAPAAAQLGNKRLLIVADGALQSLPFAMLPEPGDEGGGMKDEKKTLHLSSFIPHPLIVNHEIVSLPSASVLAVLRRELAGRAPAPKQLAIFADPVFSASDPRLKLAAKPRVAAAPTAARMVEHLPDDAGAGRARLIPRLPFTREEANQILALASTDASFKAMDFKASRALALGTDLAQYRYLHFATHGYLDSERAGLSALVLSLVDEDGRAQDGFLRAHELYNLNLPAELVVLSACQTGLGKNYSGEGMIGLTRGFMYAGAARVIVSLWNINDRATASLMVRFYQKVLKDGERPAAALRQAQIEMWQQGKWQAPYYWAAFVLQGEWR